MLCWDAVESGGMDAVVGELAFVDEAERLPGRGMACSTRGRLEPAVAAEAVVLGQCNQAGLDGLLAVLRMNVGAGGEVEVWRVVPSLSAFGRGYCPI